jgi:hypothetical protein
VSKFFKALEQAERDNTDETRQAPMEAGEQAPVVPRWPEPDKERPSVFTPPAPSRTAVPEPPRPAVGPVRPAVSSPRVATALVDEHLMSLQAPSTAAAEQYRVLRHLVETLRRRANLRILGVTSPGVGDGKSITAINLGGALAQSEDARVLLIDMDLRRPALARLALGEARPTLADALGTPGLPLNAAVVSVPRFNLSMLRAPVSVAAPYELLRSKTRDAPGRGAAGVRLRRHRHAAVRAVPRLSPDLEVRRRIRDRRRLQPHAARPLGGDVEGHGPGQGGRLRVQRASQLAGAVLRLSQQSGRDDASVAAQRRGRVRVVAIGGGTGLPVVLTALRRHLAPRDRIAAIVTAADDGGSSGALRKESRSGTICSSISATRAGAGTAGSSRSSMARRRS